MAAKTTPHLTHVARPCADLDRTIDFYERYGELHVVHQRVDDGVRVAWLGEADHAGFVLVFIEIAVADAPPSSGAHHLGYDLPSRQAVDAVAARAAAEGILAEPPIDAGGVVGYYCMVRDPDGSFVEFSHGQPVGPLTS
jgi:catechol 2,3-dioxygenase-like lactoylglutathione lyase family enzyme